MVYLEHTNLSEAQKIELLRTLWSIMSAFVDLSFRTDSVQQVPASVCVDLDTDGPMMSAVEPAERG